MALLDNKLAAALAAGNCVVVKPSEHASVTTLEFCKLIEAGFPPGVFRSGDARTGQALASAEGLDRSAPGSGGGRSIASAAERRSPGHSRTRRQVAQHHLRRRRSQQGDRQNLRRHLLGNRPDLRGRLTASVQRPVYGRSCRARRARGQGPPRQPLDQATG